MTPRWWQQSLNVIQTNLQVADTPRLDAERLMDQMVELNCDAIVFNAAGIYAWYPTKVPFHTVNPFMGGRDVLREAIEAARSRRIRFIARTSIGHGDERIYHHHPEWFAREPDGRPMIIGEPRPGPWGLLYQTCPNSAYQREAVAFPFYREILAEYAIDGFFVTFIGFPRPCYCGNCRARYRRETGEELPDENASAGARRAFAAWRARCSAELFQTIANLIRSHNPDLLVTGEFGGTPHTPWSLARACDVLSPNCTDRIGEGAPPRWAPAVQTSYARALVPGAPPWTIVAPAPGLLWRHTTLPTAELRAWLAQIPANGGNMWHALTGIPDTQCDRRLLPVIRKLDAQVHALRAELAARSAAPVAVLWSRQALEHDPRGPEGHQNEVYGFFEALTAHHVPFDVIPDEALIPERLREYRALVLPHTSCLSDEQVEAVNGFKAAGGGLVSTHETGLYDGAGRRRPQAALAQWTGFLPAHRLDSQVASYVRLEAADHPLLAGIGDTDLVPFDGRLSIGDWNGATCVALTYVPPFAPASGVGAPPERATLPEPRTTIPVLVERISGETRTITFCADFGAMAWRYKLPDHLLVLANAVRHAAGGHACVALGAHPGLQVSLFRQEGRLLVHLVNVAGARPLGETMPYRDVSLGVHLSAAPGYRHAAAARACIGQTDLPVAMNGLWAHVQIPLIELWEVIRFELTS